MKECGVDMNSFANSDYCNQAVAKPYSGTITLGAAGGCLTSSTEVPTVSGLLGTLDTNIDDVLNTFSRMVARLDSILSMEVATPATNTKEANSPSMDSSILNRLFEFNRRLQSFRNYIDNINARMQL